MKSLQTFQNFFAAQQDLDFCRVLETDEGEIVKKILSLRPRAYARGLGGLGLTPLEFATLQTRHYLCKGVCVCFRTFFACLMST